MLDALGIYTTLASGNNTVIMYVLWACVGSDRKVIPAMFTTEIPLKHLTYDEFTELQFITHVLPRTGIWSTGRKDPFSIKIADSSIPHRYRERVESVTGADRFMLPTKTQYKELGLPDLMMIDNFAVDSYGQMPDRRRYGFYNISSSQMVLMLQYVNDAMFDYIKLHISNCVDFNTYPMFSCVEEALTSNHLEPVMEEGTVIYKPPMTEYIYKDMAEFLKINNLQHGALNVNVPLSKSASRYESIDKHLESILDTLAISPKKGLIEEDDFGGILN